MNLKNSLIIVMLLSFNSHGMGAVKSACEKYPALCEIPKPEPTPVPVPNPIPIPDPPKPDPVPVPNPVKDFDWNLVFKWGGPEININKTVKDWTVTQHITSLKISGGNLISSRTGPDFSPCFGGDKKLQGTFNALVKQADGSYIASTWDYERCSRQNLKTLSNLASGGTMAKSLNLVNGSEICFFMSCNARNNQKNCEARSDVKCLIWKQ